LPVGSPGEDSSATDTGAWPPSTFLSASGAVYVFERTGTSWSQQAFVKASNADLDHNFGHDVALSDSGTTLVVGAPRERSSSSTLDVGMADDTAYDAGAAYVFVRGGSVWTQQAYLKASNTDANDHFGTTVALSAHGLTLAVGADGEDSSALTGTQDGSDHSAADAGAVYVYRFASSWSFNGYVKATNTDAADWFGGAIALSADGSRLACGASGEDSEATVIDGDQGNTGSDVGAVYIFW